MQKWICKYCGGDTSNADMDYLVDYDHLNCILKEIDEAKKPKSMKIKNWDKINGYTYKGHCIVNPVYAANGNRYYADVLDLNLPQKPKWHLELMIGGDVYHGHTLTLLDGNGLNITHLIELVDIRTSALFRVRFEEIIDEMLKVQLTSATRTKGHSYQTSAASTNSGGILKTINTSGTNIVLSGNSGGQTTYYNLIDTIQEMQKQIDILTTKLNPPTNPF